MAIYQYIVESRELSKQDFLEYDLSSISEKREIPTSGLFEVCGNFNCVIFPVRSLLGYFLA